MTNLILRKITKVIFVNIAIFCFAISNTSVIAASVVDITVHLPNGDKNYSAPTSAPTSVEQVMKDAGISYTATFYPSIGYAAVAIVGYPEATTGGFGMVNWHLCVNGKTANKGMSDMMVNAGSKVDWFYLVNGTCPKN